MDLEKIREFHVLAHTLNFTQAARNMNVSVSALSKHIQALENELGFALLTRSINGGQGVLTEAGRAFLTETQPWLESYDGIVERCRKLRQPDPPVRVDGVGSWTINVTSQISHILGTRGKAPVGLTCLGTTLPTREALDKKTADFACYYEPVPMVRWIEDDEGLKQTYGYIPLAPERLFAIVGAGNPVYGQDTISLSEIERSHDVVMSDSLYNNWLNANAELFERHGCKLSFEFGSDMPLYGDAFPLGPRNITIVPAKFAEYYAGLDVEDVSVLDIEGEPLQIYPFLVYRRDTTSPLVQEIVHAFETRGL